MPISKYFKGHGRDVMQSMTQQYGPEKAECVFYATANKTGMKPRNTMTPAKRAMRDRSTRGSPPMELPEFRAGYRRLS